MQANSMESVKGTAEKPMEAYRAQIERSLAAWEQVSETPVSPGHSVVPAPRPGRVLYSPSSNTERCHCTEGTCTLKDELLLPPHKVQRRQRHEVAERYPPAHAQLGSSSLCRAGTNDVDSGSGVGTVSDGFALGFACNASHTGAANQNVAACLYPPLLARGWL
jgi:hypothetical protein